MTAERKGMVYWLLGGWFLDKQPSWSKRLFWIVGFPAWLLWGWFILSGEIDNHQGLALLVFAVFAVVAVIANFYFFKALWRGDR